MFANYLTMDEAMLLSLVNMQLRNRFDSLAALANFYELDEQSLDQRLTAGGYCYHAASNQYRAG
ncbi:MAG: DUF4250 domain-containing protein [Gammaproteobacteria bacterium]|nr:DUF4250 domain-containing protein [Gammaproteobacteria bacterium]